LFLYGEAGGFFAFLGQFSRSKNFFQIFFGKGAILGVHFAPLCPNERRGYFPAGDFPLQSTLKIE